MKTLTSCPDFRNENQTFYWILRLRNTAFNIHSFLCLSKRTAVKQKETYFEFGNSQDKLEGWGEDTRIGEDPRNLAPGKLMPQERSGQEAAASIVTVDTGFWLPMPLEQSVKIQNPGQGHLKPR